MQVIFFKENVAFKLANMEQRELLNDGDTVNKPFRSKPRSVPYVKGTDIVVKDRSATNEALTVDTARVVPFYVDDLDKIQNKWASATKFAQDGMRLLNNELDQSHNAEYSNASSDVYNSDVGGSGATTSIVLAVTNVQQIFTSVNRKLDDFDIPQGDRYAMIGPRILEQIRLYIGGKDTTMADIVGNNGIVMERFGLRLVYSNNIAYTATLGMATAPSENDTVSIAGVAFRFKAAPSAANDVDIGNAATSVANLVAAINDTGTAGSTYIQLSDNDRWKLVKAGVVATDVTTTITIVGYGDLVVAETLTDATDAWASQQSHPMSGLTGAVDMVVQKSPNVEFRMAEKRLGRYVYPWMLFGKKTFADQADALVATHLDASAWT